MRDAYHFIEFQMLPHEVDELMQVDDELKRLWLIDFGGEFEEENPDPVAFCKAINELAKFDIAPIREYGMTEDEGSYLDMLEFTRELLEDEQSKYEITNSIKEHIEVQYRSVGNESGLRIDMLGYAFDKVNWNEIADNWIEMAKDYCGD